MINDVRTWVEIDTKAAKRNYTVLRRLLKPECQLMAVVKSNAYGHDLIPFSKLLEKFGADWLGIDSLVEALALRTKNVRKPILVLGYTLPHRFAEAAKHKVSLTISTLENLKALKNSPVKFHLKIDTGMHRQGFLPKDMPRVLRELKRWPEAKNYFEGIYTHFAAAKNPAFPQDTKKQIAEFKKVLALVEANGFKPLRHAAATASTMLFPETHLDMVRLGIGLYGLWPAKEVAAAFSSQLELKPVLSWKTIISEIKKLPALSRVGYDLTETLVNPSTIAICPIGYWHGYPRALSSIGHVLIGGGVAKVVGRVSMDIIIIDVTGIKNPRVGDEVVILGRKGATEISADYLAYLTDTSPYEIIARLNPLMKRVYR